MSQSRMPTHETKFSNRKVINAFSRGSNQWIWTSEERGLDSQKAHSEEKKWLMQNML